MKKTISYYVICLLLPFFIFTNKGHSFNFSEDPDSDYSDSNPSGFNFSASDAKDASEANTTNPSDTYTREGIDTTIKDFNEPDINKTIKRMPDILNGDSPSSSSSPSFPNSSSSPSSSSSSSSSSSPSSSSTTDSSNATDSPSSSDPTTSATKTNTPNDEFISNFDSNKLFPNWDDGNVKGIIGKNGNNNESTSFKKGPTKLLLYFIPQLTTILLKIVSPVIVFMFIFAGIRFIYAGDDEEQIKASKTFFQYGIMGVVFIVFSYSVMKSIYYIISEKTPSVAIKTNINLKTINTKTI